MATRDSSLQRERTVFRHATIRASECVPVPTLSAHGQVGPTMNQLKVIPRSNVLPLRVAQVLRGKANRQREAKGNDYLGGATQAALPLTRQRLELIKAYGKPQARNA